MTGIGGKEGAIQAISIHTSAREVTDYDPMKLMSDINFNPHFRKGSDEDFLQIVDSIADFNPHFRKGSDISFDSFSTFLRISIHTSAREVTIAAYKKAQIPPISIHTSAREVTCVKRISFLRISISIHTSAREVTLPAANCLFPA